MHTKLIHLLIINLEYFLWPCAKKSLFDPLKQSRKTLWSTLKQSDFSSGSKWYFCTSAMEKISYWLSARNGSESDYQNVFFIQMLNEIYVTNKRFRKWIKILIQLTGARPVSWWSEKAKLSMNGINVPSQDPLRVGSDQITTDYEKSSRGDSRESRESRSSSISTLGDSTSLPREYD